MNKVRETRMLVAGVLATFAAVVGVGLMMHADSHVTGSVVARPVDWAVLAVAVAAIAGAGWSLLGQGPRAGAHRDRRSHARCPSCEREVFGEWRMCPYCGAMIDVVRASATGAEAAEG